MIALPNSLTRSLLSLVGLFTVVAIASGSSLGCIDTLAESDEFGIENVPEELVCKSDSDCEEGEACTKGACLPKRCGDSDGDPPPPIGQRGYLTLREGLVVANESTVSGYSFADGQLTNAGLPGAANGALDVSGGHFHAERPESIALVRPNGASVEFVGKAPKSVSIGFIPVAVTSGDPDGDGVDDAIAVSASGDVAFCSYESGSCKQLNAGAGGVIDAAAGDLDGDGQLEVVLLDDRKQLTVATIAADRSKITKTATLQDSGASPADIKRLAIGDLDGDGKPEIVGLDLGWTFGSAKLYALGVTAEGYTSANETVLEGSPTDVAIGWLDGERGYAIVLAGTTASLYAHGEKTFTTPTRLTLPASGGTRLAASDFEGRSATARSLGPAKVVEGRLTPIAAIFPPPYSRTYSAAGSWASVGSEESSGGSKSQGVAANYSGFVSFSVPLPLGSSVGAGFSRGWGTSVTRSLSHSVSASSTFFINANPEADGYQSGAVMLSCACYRKYDFQVEDPTGASPADATVSIFLPIGPRTQVVGLRRYAALVKALPEELPPINATFKLGDLSSYPKTPTTITGKPIPAGDIVFKNAPSLRASDSSDVMFRLATSVQESNTTATSYSSGVNVNFYSKFVSAGGEVTERRERSESIEIGATTAFMGRIPPIRDDASTPEDEYEEHAYSFTPVVYLQRYSRKDGGKAGFYVLTYTIGE